MSLSLSDSQAMGAARVVTDEQPHAATVTSATRTPPVFAAAAWHSLFWLVLANAIGVLVATLLIAPSLNSALGEWTYGRWMPVHLNLQLYGWCSLPFVAFLFKVYGADREPVAIWGRPVLWVWSSALAIGALNWLTGHSSGKLFLDWTGYSLILFALALATLWCLLVFALANGWRAPENSSQKVRVTKLLGLALLLLIPALFYVAASPVLYPPINPDSGGPTGASQLESSLVIVAILLLLPYGLTRRKAGHTWLSTLAWCIFAAECLLCMGLGRADVSHHLRIQYISLGSLLVWLPLTPAYYGSFEWHANTRRWRIAFLCWWAALVATGWWLFLPGMLDYFKFTDGLVSHSLLAMAGFVSSLLIFVMVQLLGEDGCIFNRTWSFYVWQISVVAFVLLMFVAGWLEGSNPAFTMVPGTARNAIYALRLVVGVLMFAASAQWLLDATMLLRAPVTRSSTSPRNTA
jgi:cytochrome c oxidase cbb3-type subunit 1